MSKEEADKYFERKKNKVNAVWSERAYTIYSLLSQFVTNNEWKQAIEERKFINSGILDSTLAALEELWFIGKAFKAVGRSKVKEMIQGYLITQGQGVFKI